MFVIGKVWRKSKLIKLCVFLVSCLLLYLYYYWASDLDYILLGEIPVIQRIVKLETEDEEKSTKGLIVELLPGGKRVKEDEH
jgi:hypothetical protein